MHLFRKKNLSELDIELKKYPRRKRKQLRELYIQYEKGKVLKPINDNR